MGELKTLREQQESLVARVKELNHKLFLASVGAYSKVEAESSKVLDKYAQAGGKAFGDEAGDKKRVQLVVRGLADAVKSVDTKELTESLTTNAKAFYSDVPEKRAALYEQLVDAGREERGDKADETNEFVLAGFGVVATASQKSQGVFSDLVAAGEARES